MRSAFVYNENISEQENEKNISRFRVLSLPKELLDEGIELDKRIDKLNKKSGVLGKAVYFIFIIGMVFLFSILLNISKNPNAIIESLPIFIISCLAVLLGIGYYIGQYISTKKLRNSEEVKEITRLSNAFMKKRDDFFGIPSDAKIIDICFKHVKRVRASEEMDVLSLPEDDTFVANIGVTAFVKNNKLHLADTESVYGFDLSNYKREEKNENKVKFTSWNKKKPYRRDEYAQYYIKFMGAGFLSIIGSYRFVFEIDNEEYYLEVLPYDYDVMKKLIEG